ncbi:MAG: DUF1289 domain-containing protein [Planctomycetota bacterium]
MNDSAHLHENQAHKITPEGGERESPRRLQAPESPCVGICRVDAERICQGCYRDLSEIGRWSAATAREKHTILDRVEARKAVAPPGVFSLEKQSP